MQILIPGVLASNFRVSYWIELWNIAGHHQSGHHNNSGVTQQELKPNIGKMGVNSSTGGLVGSHSNTPTALHSSPDSGVLTASGSGSPSQQVYPTPFYLVRHLLFSFSKIASTTENTFSYILKPQLSLGRVLNFSNWTPTIVLSSNGPFKITFVHTILRAKKCPHSHSQSSPG